MTSTPEAIDWSSRPKTVDYARIEGLQFLGKYTRRLPVSIERMIENAFDWEHLPHVHASSFASIECIDSGAWGWRARAGQPPAEGAVAGDNEQLLELLVDRAGHYWATTIVDGPAAGIEIHTQATPLTDSDIVIDVGFYSAQPLPQAQVPLYYDVLREQYALLYDEDLLLMLGRQRALDARDARRNHPVAAASTGAPLTLLLGDVDSVFANVPLSVDTPEGRYCIRRHAGHWLVHSAVCPHRLGPLDEAVPDAEGAITCPWHGYRFDLVSGDNLDGQCTPLNTAAEVVERSGNLYLVVPT